MVKKLLRKITGYDDLMALYKQTAARVPVLAEQNPQVEFIREDIHGNKWYAFKEVENMTWVRMEAYWIALAAADLRLTPEELVNSMVEMNTLFTTALGDALSGKRDEAMKKQGEFATLVNGVYGRMNSTLETRTLTALAKTFLVMEGEPLGPTLDTVKDWGSIVSDWNAKKQRVFDTDVESRCFFLQLAAKRLSGLRNIDAEELMEYLAALPYRG